MILLSLITLAFVLFPLVLVHRSTAKLALQPFNSIFTAIADETIWNCNISSYFLASICLLTSEFVISPSLGDLSYLFVI